MKQLSTLTTATVLLLFLGLGLPAGEALGQAKVKISKEQLRFLISRSDAAHNASVSSFDAACVHDLRITLAQDSDISRRSNCNARVRPGTSSGITKFSEHEADGCEAQECERLVIEILPILGKPSASVEPSNGSLDQPTCRI